MRAMSFSGRPHRGLEQADFGLGGAEVDPVEELHSLDDDLAEFHEAGGAQCVGNGGAPAVPSPDRR